MARGLQANFIKDCVLAKVNSLFNSGEIEYKDGRTYSGNWNLGNRDGQGVFKWPSIGLKYEGRYRGGYKKGLGKYTFPTGESFTCKYNGKDQLPVISLLNRKARPSLSALSTPSKSSLSLKMVVQYMKVSL